MMVDQKRCVRVRLVGLFAASLRNIVLNICCQSEVRVNSNPLLLLPRQSQRSRRFNVFKANAFDIFPLLWNLS